MFCSGKCVMGYEILCRFIFQYHETGSYLYMHMSKLLNWLDGVTMIGHVPI